MNNLPDRFAATLAQDSALVTDVHDYTNWQTERQSASHTNTQEYEIAHLRALNHLAQDLNRSVDVQTALNATLETLVKVMGLQTAWVSLLADTHLIPAAAGDSTNPDFVLAAAYGLPPGLEHNDCHHLRAAPHCRCQALLRSGRLTRAVNIVECTRLRNAAAAGDDTQGLLFHATIPIISQDRPLGLVNVATNKWQIFTRSDLQLLSTVGAQLAIALERARLYDIAQAQRARLEHELEMARIVQASLLPDKLPHIPGFELAAKWCSASEVAGDFYAVFPLADGRWGMVIADVSGKGAPAALYMAMALSLIRTAAEHADSPAQALTQANQALEAQSSAQMFVTVFYAILDPTTRALTYTNAGHNRPILKPASVSTPVTQLPQGGLPLGLFNAITLTDTTLELAPGDTLVLYTDGLTETFSPQNQMFGAERLMQTIHTLPTTSPQELVETLLAQSAAFANNTPQADDITIVAIHCLANPASFPKSI